MAWSFPAVLLLFSSFVGSDVIGRRIDDFQLQDFRGKPHSLADFKDAHAVVVAFLGVECPLAKLYAPKLQKLSESLAGKGVRVIAIDSNEHDSMTELAAFARTHGISFPLLKDPGNHMADRFTAARTPEVFVLDRSRTIRYRGRIDDQYGIGFLRDAPKSRDLEAALNEVLAGKPVSKPVTDACGCIIGRAKSPKSGAQVTYSKHIAPIFQARCVECHRSGAIAPFSLTDYSESAGWAEMIQEVVDNHRMPPWHADAKYGKFVDERRLSDDERKLIRRWVADGAPEGDPKDLPKPRQFATGWHQARKPDVVLDMRPTPFQVPAEGVVRYQYFVVDPGFKEDKWISASEVVPGNSAVVHHLLVLAFEPGQTDDEARGGAGGFMAAFVPGLRAKPYPKGMAKKIVAGTKLVFQVHYTPNGSPQQDLSKLGLWFVDPKTIDYEVKTLSAATNKFRIPPYDGNHQVEADSRALPVDGLLLAMMPHMHLRGKAFRYEAVFPDGKRETLLDVPQYDFNWQTAYRLAEPRKLPRGTKVHGVAHYDNSENNLSNPDPSKPVRWGDQTFQEMMIGYFDLAISRDKMAEFKQAAQRGGGLRERLAQGLRNRMTPEMLLQRFDKNRDGVIDRSEVPDNLQSTFDRLDTNGNGKLDKAELSLLSRQ